MHGKKSTVHYRYNEQRNKTNSQYQHSCRFTEAALQGTCGGSSPPVKKARPRQEIKKLCQNFELNRMNKDLNLNAPGFFHYTMVRDKKTVRHLHKYSTKRQIKLIGQLLYFPSTCIYWLRTNCVPAPNEGASRQEEDGEGRERGCLLYTSPSPRD